MKKIKNIGSSKLKTMIKNNFLDNSTLSEEKIDSIIREYLIEREEIFVDVDDEQLNISDISVEVIEGVIDGIKTMVDDLEIIKIKEDETTFLNKNNKTTYVGDEIGEIMDGLEEISEKLYRLLGE
jgi:hypothetical protein